MYVNLIWIDIIVVEVKKCEAYQYLKAIKYTYLCNKLVLKQLRSVISKEHVFGLIIKGKCKGFKNGLL